MYIYIERLIKDIEGIIINKIYITPSAIGALPFCSERGLRMIDHVIAHTRSIARISNMTMLMLGLETCHFLTHLQGSSWRLLPTHLMVPFARQPVAQLSPLLHIM